MKAFLLTMTLPCRVLLLATVVLLPLAGQKKPVTLEAVTMTRPEAPGTPVWSPDGKRFVYRQGDTFHAYDVTAKASKELLSRRALQGQAIKTPEATTFSWENRRVSEQAAQWFPNNEELLLSAGGDLFRVALATGKAEPLTRTEAAEADPKLSPDGRRIAFRRGHDLYVMELDSRRELRLTTDGSPTLLNGELDWVYPEELDLGTAFWWSPDSQQVAYLQFDVSRQMLYPHADLLKPRAVAEPQRYPQAGTPNADVRLGVVPATADATPPTRWMDLGETRDILLARVHWVPGGRQLFVQRMNRVQDRLDLLLVDVESRSAKPISTERDRTWVNIASDLTFLPGRKQYLWSSERTGFRHLYLYGMDGAPARSLTEGDWETSQVVGVDEKRGFVYYLSTQESPLERHLYRVSLDGKDRRRLTREAGSHTVSMSPTAEHYVATFSSTTTPPRRTLHAADGQQLAVLHEADARATSEYDVRPSEFVSFTDPQGTRFHARLIKPANFQAGRQYPAVVMVYGGPQSQSVRNTWTGLSFEQALAHRGFVVWQMDNRGSAGRGHEWESRLYRRLGKTELEDQLTGLKHLLSLGFVDPQRVGIHGWSYGGYMTLYALLNAPDAFRAGVAGAPVTDWRLYDTIYTERYLGLPSENPDGYRDSSVVHQAANLKGKLMLVHNVEDDNVLFQNALQMMNALTEAGKPFETQLYTQKAHGVTGKPRLHMLQAIADFFERTLK